MRRKVRAFVRRVRSGQLGSALYLAYYYTYLSLYDVRFGTHFSNSQTPDEMGSSEVGGTGNFPAHPRLVRRLLAEAGVGEMDAVIDVGHGSGSALFAAYRAGLRNLTGVEYGRVPYELSVRNLGTRATLIHGDAMSLDLTPFSTVLFFSPFRGDLAVSFFEGLPADVTTVCAVNHDPVIEPLLRDLEFRLTWEYQHPLYEPFNAHVWKRGSGS